MTTESFTLNQYLITTSLGERSIYVKIVDKITYTCYESNLDIKEFRISASIEDIYKIISKCFEEEDTNYSVKFTLQTGCLKMVFEATLGGFFKVGFEIILREKVMSNDAQLTMNFHRIEQKQKQEMEELVEQQTTLFKKIEDRQKREIMGLNKQLETIQQELVFMKTVQKHLYIMLCPYVSPHVIGINVKISIPEFTLVISGHNYPSIIYENIQCLYNLTSLKISITGVDFTPYFSKIIHPNLLKLSIDSNSPSYFTSLNGINNFPKLTHLEITCCGVSDIVKVLTPIKHSIIEITLKNCGATINQTEMMTYCTAKGIKLNMS